MRPLHRWGPLAVVAATALLPFWGLWRAPGPPMEEGFMLVFPELVLNGWVPHRDFLHLYGPGSLWVLAGTYGVFGTTLEVQRLVGFAQQLGVAFGVFALLRPFGRWTAGAGGAVAAMIIVPPIGLTALAWVGGVALGLWYLNAGLRAVEHGPGRRGLVPVGAGLLAGAALLYRPDLVVAIGLSGLVLLRGLDRGGRVRLLAGFAAGVAPYLVHVATAGLGTAFHGLVIQPVFELRPGRALPLPPSWDRFDGFLQRAGTLRELPWPLPAPPGPPQLTFWLVLLVASVALLLAVGVRAARRGAGTPPVPAVSHLRLLALALFSVGLLPQAMQRADSTHLAWASAVPFGLAVGALAHLLAQRWPAWRDGARAAVAVAVPLVLLLALVPHFTWRTYADYVAQTFGYHRLSYVLERDGRIFRYGRADAVAAVERILADVERVATPGDRLFVGTGDLRKTPYSEAFLYYLLPELPPATRYIEMDPGVANAPDSGLADELRAADVVILSSIRDDWDEPNASRDLGPNEPNEVLAELFCRVSAYGEGPFGRPLYALYVRC